MSKKHDHAEQAGTAPEESAQAADLKAQPAETTLEAQTVPKAKYDELVETLQRLQAEFENFKKRSERDNAEYCAHANSALLRSLLPVLDTFELSLVHATPEEKASSLAKGVELVMAQLVDALETNGVAVINPAQGERFDPRRHEAILAEAQQGAEKNTILEVLQKGYVLKERVLRTAKVKVAK